MAEKKDKSPEEQLSEALKKIEEQDQLLAGNAALIEDLNGQLSQKDSEIKRLDDALAEAEGLIEEQQAALSEPAEESEKVLVKHNKRTYQVRTPRFKLGGQEYEAADLKSKPNLVKQLVEKRSSVLVAVK